jgi:hypothetical protein
MINDAFILNLVDNDDFVETESDIFNKKIEFLHGDLKEKIFMNIRLPWMTLTKKIYDSMIFKVVPLMESGFIPAYVCFDGYICGLLSHQWN